VIVATEADSPEAATESVRAMCRRLLANPVIEDFEIASVTRS
jgi:phosphoribosylformylglycinamidine (FGAM) synthase PurS component